jgi:hypothetical protein
MGVMAVSTIHDSGFNIEMSFFKGCLLRIVALSAQSLNRLVHQGSLGRRMGGVASLAIPTSRRMGFFFFHPHLQVFMTRLTEIRALGQKKTV